MLLCFVVLGIVLLFTAKVVRADITQSQTDEIIATTFDKVKKNLINHTLLDVPLYEELFGSPYREGVNGGHRIRFPFVIDNNDSFAWFGWGATFDPQPKRIVGWAHATLKQGAGDVVVEWLEGQMNKGPEAFVNLLRTKLDDLEQSIRQSLNTNAWGDGTGAGGLEPTGVAGHIPNTPLTGTYMGFSRVTDFWCRPWYWDGVTYGPHSLTAPSGAAVQPVGDIGDVSDGVDLIGTFLTTMWNSIAARENKTNMFHLTDQATYEWYLRIPTYCRGRDIGIHEGEFNLGMTGASFMGAPIRWDTVENGAIAGEWRTINKLYYKVFVDTSAFFKWTPPREPYNALRNARYLLVRFQTANTYPRKSGILTGITTWRA